MKIGDKVRIKCLDGVGFYSDALKERYIKESKVYTITDVGINGFNFTGGERKFYCAFEDDIDFEYRLVDEKEILKECQEFEEQLKKKEEIRLKAKEEAKEYMEKNDKVNHPSHYQTAGGIEVIEYIASLLGDNVKAYYLGNVIKYISRFDKKNGIEDLEKARFYLNKIIEMGDE